MELADRSDLPSQINRTSISRRKKVIFAVVPSLVLAMVVFLFWIFAIPKRGSALSRYAWERTYSDRHVPIPAIGPRDGGFRGERVFPKSQHPATGWCEPPVHLPGILEIDSKGLQYHRSSDPSFQILFVGGSVATGTYATTTALTYFGLIGARLNADHLPSSITVFAAGAWKSIQDVAAMEYVVNSGLKPDLVVYINGLNDLTNGATADTLFGEQTATKNGTRWTRLYHEHDYERRVARYMLNMQNAVKFARSQRMAILIVLQPALFERDPLTDVERNLLTASLTPHESQQRLAQSYAQMRSRLAELADDQHVFFVDCSRLLNADRATTFTDMWHFSDFGHQQLAEALTPHIEQILKRPAQRVPVDTQ